MEIISPYLGKFEEESIFLNNGKFGYYLNHNKKLYSVPQCFQKPTFKLKDAVKIIEYRRNKEAEKENDAERPSALVLQEPKGATEDSDEIKPFKKNKKKF
jgi:topoisomerase IA-like protein